MALNKVQGPSTGPTEYIKAAFQWLNSLLDPIRDIWVRNLGSDKDNTNLKSLHQIETVVFSIDKRIEDLELYYHIVKDKNFLDSKTKTQLLHEFNLCKLAIISQKKILAILLPSDKGSFIERKKQDEMDILNDRMEKLTELQMKLGFSTFDRDKIQLTHDAKKFADTLAEIVTKIMIPRKKDVMDLAYFNRQSTNPIENFAFQLAEQIFLPFSPEEIQIVTQAIEERLIEKFKTNPKIQDPEQLAHQIATSQTQKLANKLREIIRQNFNQ